MNDTMSLCILRFLITGEIFGWTTGLCRSVLSMMMVYLCLSIYVFMCGSFNLVLPS